ncbi:MAG: alpha-amylase family glycosyl hydrolase [Chitinophagaceae bacterium]
MYNHQLHQRINELLLKKKFDIAGRDNQFYIRLMANADAIHSLYMEIYGHFFSDAFDMLIDLILNAYLDRSDALKSRDVQKADKGNWFLSNEIAGMSLYVDRFCGDIKSLSGKLDYFEELGVNFLHLMPVFESPEGESDGGYAVSNFRKVEERFGNIQDLRDLQNKMQKSDMYLMLDIVLNHTSYKHEWAERAKKGEKKYQDYYYMYDDRRVPDEMERNMPEIFPESSPGSFSYVEDCRKWVMTVFHHYQWDLNYTNAEVFREMLSNIFFYANLGVDVLRIDAPAFIWKESGTSCQNLPQAHTLLRLIKQCVMVSAPGMALLGEAIVRPNEIMKYFGTGNYTARECDVAYNATHMALQWDMIATSDTRIMLAAQHEILQKPYGTTWINYTRCHDDIGLGYDDYMIEQAGFNAREHRQYLMNYFAGYQPDSPAKGALFSFNPKTGDARISGSLASLCGLEKALKAGDQTWIKESIRKILLMQAHSFFLGGIPVIFYGDEWGSINDYSFLNDSGKSYDNRWMHRPIYDWDKLSNIKVDGTIESEIFHSTSKLITIRKKLSVIADHKNLTWMTPHNIHVAGYIRSYEEQRVWAVFNFSKTTAFLTWHAFKEHGHAPSKLFDHWTGKTFEVGYDHEHLILEPYGFHILEMV